MSDFNEIPPGTTGTLTEEQIKELESIRFGRNWIDVNDRKPSCESYVLAYNGDPHYGYDVVKYCSGQWTNNDFHKMMGVTHWMFLPEPPR